MVAAERTGRRARLLELDPRYVDVVVRRWQVGGGCVIHAETAKPFEKCSDIRG